MFDCGIQIGVLISRDLRSVAFPDLESVYITAAIIIHLSKFEDLIFIKIVEKMENIY